MTRWSESTRTLDKRRRRTIPKAHPTVRGASAPQKAESAPPPPARPPASPYVGIVPAPTEAPVTRVASLAPLEPGGIRVRIFPIFPKGASAATRAAEFLTG